jgi:hypothetical protein
MPNKFISIFLKNQRDMVDHCVTIHDYDHCRERSSADHI